MIGTTANHLEVRFCELESRATQLTRCLSEELPKKMLKQVLKDAENVWNATEELAELANRCGIYFINQNGRLSALCDTVYGLILSAMKRIHTYPKLWRKIVNFFSNALNTLAAIITIASSITIPTLVIISGHLVRF